MQSANTDSHRAAPDSPYVVYPACTGFQVVKPKVVVVLTRYRRRLGEALFASSRPDRRDVAILFASCSSLFYPTLSLAHQLEYCHASLSQRGLWRPLKHPSQGPDRRHNTIYIQCLAMRQRTTCTSHIPHHYPCTAEQSSLARRTI